jgi:murein DD-endopeptidase MepM/ murein hydrolase activator NlpD
MTSHSFTIVFFLLHWLFSGIAFSLEIRSPWIQGGLILGQTEPGNKLRFLNYDVRVSPSGNFVIGLGRDAPTKAVLIETFPSGRSQTHEFTVTQRQYNEQRVNGVPQHTVAVPESALRRIGEENKLAKNARQIDSNREDFLQKFSWPAKGIISGVYGSRRIYNGEPRRPHYGVDIAAPEGTHVVAPISGKVTLVHTDMYFSGGTLIIDHGYGVSSTFIHLHKILVSDGDEVQKGQLIAKIGSTGRATGPHLDWRMNWFDQRLDPQLLMDSLPEKL